ncbi:hypothetical protein TNIN_413631 [Trichonephila inaurata madagascariensis]|uniref:Uncharacterized protein n=1 Tax=Trichonephila inaurata madagascariensis TaxID=2747483 RepID=A0A8X7BU39_9ARAC|nr:hypothetical protein TNIN_413631 [Trichonephila inaurata madagascariensis]
MCDIEENLILEGISLRKQILLPDCSDGSYFPALALKYIIQKQFSYEKSIVYRGSRPLPQLPEEPDRRNPMADLFLAYPPR